VTYGARRVLAGNITLYVSDWNGATPRRLGEAGGFGASWDPSGRRLAFGGIVGGRPGSYVVALPAGRPRRVAAEQSVDWLPSGHLLVADVRGLVLMQPSGAVLRTLVPRSPRIENLLPVGSGRGRLVYQSNAYLGHRLFTMRPDGSRIRAVVTDRYSRTWPAWSPDGSRLAFSRCSIDECHRGGGLELHVMNADGTSARRVTAGDPNETTYDRGASWSPDGRWLAFSRFLVNGDEGIYVVAADGSGLTHLADGYTPDWSPDGARIAFSRSDGLFTIRADGTGLARVVASTGAGAPAWSPDGRRLAFAGSDGIYVAGVDGGGLRRVVRARGPGTASSGNPEWSPDGAQIVFEDCSRCTGLRGNTDLFVVNADGSGRRRLTTAEGHDGGANWRSAP
jgi:TolB protein